MALVRSPATFLRNLIWTKVPFGPLASVGQARLPRLYTSFCQLMDLIEALSFASQLREE